MTAKQKTAFEALISMSGISLNEDQRIEVFKMVSGIVTAKTLNGNAVEAIAKDLGYMMQQTSMFEDPNKIATFKNSPVGKIETFIAQFTAPEFKHVDLSHYFNLVCNWAIKSGKRRTPRAWIATARKIMLDHKSKGKLVTLNNGLSDDTMKTFFEI